MDRWIRIGAAVLLAASGAIHLRLWDDGYKDFPNDNLGRSFLLNAIGSIAIAVAIVAWQHWLPLLAGLFTTNATLVAFGLSRATDKGIFDFTENGFSPSPEAVLALITEIGAGAAFVYLLARAASEPLPLVRRQLR